MHLSCRAHEGKYIMKRGVLNALVLCGLWPHAMDVWEAQSTEVAKAIEGALEGVCFCSVEHCLIEVDLD